MSYEIDRVNRVGHLGGLQFGACESSWFCFEIPSRDNVLRAFCFLYELERDMHVMLLGKLCSANQLGMNSRAHHICCRLILWRYRGGLCPQYLVTFKIAKHPRHSLEVLSHQLVFPFPPHFQATLRKS